MSSQYQTWEDNPTNPHMKQQPGLLYQRYDPSSPAPMHYGDDRANTSSQQSSMAERCCNHLKDFIALGMVAAFMIFSGWVCYYLISNYGRVGGAKGYGRYCDVYSLRAITNCIVGCWRTIAIIYHSRIHHGIFITLFFPFSNNIGRYSTNTVAQRDQRCDLRPTIVLWAHCSHWT